MNIELKRIIFIAALLLGIIFIVIGYLTSHRKSEAEISHSWINMKTSIVGIIFLVIAIIVQIFF